ncbi:TetR/AcrR family transcriptional regulator [Streptomyces fractus]|uniref:TetR/AcrR family transcriptional regulator n=1 Tax=Streptomyces fractus TaxID=641806 RepID=UPI003CED01CF
MPKNPTRRRPQTVAALLAGAFDAFAERGYHGASIGHICERAGLTTGAFYSNFATKQDLFLALYDRVVAERMARFEAHVRHVLKPGGSPGPAAVDDDRERQWVMISAEFGLLAMRDATVAEALAEREAARHQGVGAIFGRILTSWGRTSDLPPRDLGRLALAVHEGLAAQRYTTPGRPPGAYESLEWDVLPTVLRALSVPDGRQKKSQKKPNT